MATVIDFSTEYYSKSGASRFARISQFIGLTSGGKEITRRQLSPIESASVNLGKKLKTYEDLSAESRYSLVDEMNSLPQLPYMNAALLATALFIIESVSIKYNIDTRDGTTLLDALTPNIFDEVFDEIDLRQIDIKKEISEIQSIKLKEGIYRYIRCVSLFRSEKFLAAQKSKEEMEREDELDEEKLNDRPNIDELNREFEEKRDQDVEDEDEDEDNLVDEDEDEDDLGEEDEDDFLSKEIMLNREKKRILQQQPPSAQKTIQPIRPSQRVSAGKQEVQEPTRKPASPGRKQVQPVRPPVKQVQPVQPVRPPVQPVQPVRPPVQPAQPVRTQTPKTQPSKVGTPKTGTSITIPTVAKPILPSKPPPSKPSTSKPPASKPTTTRFHRKLRERITPIIPIDLSNKKMPKINIGNLTEIENWLNDIDNRLNMMNIKVTLVHTPDIPIPMYDKQGLIAKGNSSEYLNYVQEMMENLPQSQERAEFAKRTDIYNRLVNILNTGSIKMGRHDIYPIINKIFPNSKIRKVPSKGNCYFCAIGENLDKTSQQVRDDLSSYLIRLRRDNISSYNEYLSVLIHNCLLNTLIKALPREELYETFPDKLTIECQEGDKDCEQCLWGGVEYDQLVSEAYQLPVVEIVVDFNDDELTIGMVMFMPDKFSESDKENYTGPIISHIGTLMPPHHDFILLE